MSSDIDEECEVYSAPRRGVNPVDSRDDWNDSSPGMIHSYVNLVDRSDGEEKPALPARRNSLLNISVLHFKLLMKNLRDSDDCGG